MDASGLHPRSGRCGAERLVDCKCVMASRGRSVIQENRSAWRKPIELSSSTPGQPRSRSIARFSHHWPRLRSRICRYWMRDTHEQCWSTQRVAVCHPQIERYELEANGPVRATVLFEGTIKGRRRNRYRFRARLSFFSGLSLVRIELTLHNPRRARHRGGLWDLGDPGSLFFRDLSLQLALAGPGPRQVQWTENVDDRLKSAECNRFEIYQDSSGGENWQSPNHVNRLGRIPARFRGYRVRHDGIESYSLRASPVVTLSGDDHWHHGRHAGILAAVPESH